MPDEAEAPRHYGDPRAEYEAATGGVAILAGPPRALWLVEGRAPARMMDGILTNRVPPFPERSGSALAGRALYSAVLTPKGKMVTDLRTWWRGAEEEDGLLLDLPGAGVEAVRGHFGKFLPPRFATVAELTEDTDRVSVVGPAAAGLLEEVLGPWARPVGAMEPGDVRIEADPQGDAADALHLVGTRELGVPGFDLVGPEARVGPIRDSLTEAGATPAGRAVRETLRIEAGRPAFGVDMDGDTIPVEAGIHDEAIDYAKGCYTGQEVIVRIRDRGRVNRHLRGLLLGDAPSPAPGSELFREEGEKAVGWVTSSADSPRLGQTIALGYVRREVEPPSVLRLGEPEGTRVEVRDLSHGWSPGG